MGREDNEREDNGKRGQWEERTMGREDNGKRGHREDNGKRGQWEERMQR